MKIITASSIAVAGIATTVLFLSQDAREAIFGEKEYLSPAELNHPEADCLLLVRVWDEGDGYKIQRVHGDESASIVEKCRIILADQASTSPST